MCLSIDRRAKHKCIIFPHFLIHYAFHWIWLVAFALIMRLTKGHHPTSTQPIQSKKFFFIKLLFWVKSSEFWILMKIFRIFWLMKIFRILFSDENLQNSSFWWKSSWFFILMYLTIQERYLSIVHMLRIESISSLHVNTESIIKTQEWKLISCPVGCVVWCQCERNSTIYLYLKCVSFLFDTV